MLQAALLEHCGIDACILRLDDADYDFGLWLYTRVHASARWVESGSIGRRARGVGNGDVVPLPHAVLQVHIICIAGPKHGWRTGEGAAGIKMVTSSKDLLLANLHHGLREEAATGHRSLCSFRIHRLGDENWKPSARLQMRLRVRITRVRVSCDPV